MRNCFILFLILFSFQSIAQTTDTIHIKKDSIFSKPRINPFHNLNKLLKVKLTGDGNFAQGNVNRVLMIYKGAFQFTKPAYDLVLNAAYVYGRQNNNLAEDDYTMTLLSHILHEKPVYGWAFSTVDHSRLRGIDFRDQVGVGLGFRLFKTLSKSFSITTGILHESTKYTKLTVLNDFKLLQETWRSSTRIKGKQSLFKNRFILVHETYIQPSILNEKDLRWRTSISIEVPISKHFSMKSTFQNSHESIVSPTRKKDDSSLTFGVVICN